MHEIETARGGPPLKGRLRTTGRNADPVALTQLCRAFQAFVCVEVAPHVADAFAAAGGECSSIAFQANPSLRVNAPAAHAAGVRHRGRDYGHQPAQINYWLPLSRAFGSNTLWVELSPSMEAHQSRAACEQERASPLEGDFGVLQCVAHASNRRVGTSPLAPPPRRMAAPRS